MMVDWRFILFGAGFVRLCRGQEAGWITGQVNATMCYWKSPRAAVVRDTLYIDGGELWWSPGMADGTSSSPVSDGNPLGLVYLLNFSTPYSTNSSKQNTTTLLTTLSKALGGVGNANNFGPQYLDGTILSNDYEWFSYGGLSALTGAYSPLLGTAVLGYQAYPQLPRQFSPGFVPVVLPAEVTRYITYGAGESVPSENLGFYFSGLRSPSSGPIYDAPVNNSVLADQVSGTMITLDMSVQQQEKWSNTTLPSNVPGRAGAEIVWVPVSKQGVLVAIGGVIDPVYATLYQHNSPANVTESELKSPEFMKRVSIYDITSGKWYSQPTTGDIPPALTQGCTVLASAADGSNHNIYWYGGFPGMDARAGFSDEVYILSLPSFMWFKAPGSEATLARAAHKCVKPYPDQMLVVGGYHSETEKVPTCLPSGILQLYNLSSLSWIDAYSPTKWSNYAVPSLISSAIGGSSTGGATNTATFSDSALAALFKTPYDNTKIKNWYPYAPAPTSSTRPTLLPSAVPKSGTPSYVAPVVGVILGLLFLTVLVIAILVFRRRRLLSMRGTEGMSEAGTMDERNRIQRWLMGSGAAAAGKASTVTDEMTVPGSPYEGQVAWEREQPRKNATEVQGVQIHEMGDTSKPSELHATGFVPIAAAARPRHERNTSNSPSTTSEVSQPSSPTPDVGGSEMGGGAGAPRINQFASGVSAISEGERGHLRQISDSVSTDGAGAVSPIAGTGSGESSSPGGLGVEGMGAKGNNMRRKSNFQEGLDEIERGT